MFIDPVGKLPLNTKRSGGMIVVVALSKTARDRDSTVRAYCDVDSFLQALCLELGVTVPPSPGLPVTFYSGITMGNSSLRRWRFFVASTSTGQTAPFPHVARVALAWTGKPSDCCSSGKKRIKREEGAPGVECHTLIIEAPPFELCGDGEAPSEVMATIQWRSFFENPQETLVIKVCERATCRR